MDEAIGGECLPNFDCFPRIGNEHLQREPVQSCSLELISFLNNSNSSSGLPPEDIIMYDCYRLLFRYAEGFAATGGILAATALFSKLYFALLVTISHRVKDNDNCLLRFLFYSIIWLVCAGVLCTFLAVNLGIPTIKEAVLQSTTDIIQFVMYVIALFLIIVTGIIVTIGIEIEIQDS